MKKSLLWSLFVGLLFSFAMDKPAYQIFNQSGKKTDYEQLLKEAQKADIVFFGELHNNPICHWLQLELTKDLYAHKKNDLVLGAEMFEADNQLIVNEYLQKIITEKQLKDEAKVWDNYNTDYKPLLDFALKNQLNFVASNIPRRYANLVSRKGLGELDKLSPEAKQWLAPLPLSVDLNLPGYANMIKMMSGSHSSGMGNMSPENFANAQASKDATMAHFILKNWQKGRLLLHYNGAYHSDNFEGIVWYLKKQNPDLQILTISSVEQADLKELKKEHENKAHFIVAIPENMTKTY
ncbi:MAG: ChaN family lipoprotein [Microscillaceae bacterium]|jgi:uncharacterized iron-regulated protein|nr:ChaN family lipoprotein [Microscillaceae bacterium]